jgi:phospholipase/lecithinase/hemolysin
VFWDAFHPSEATNRIIARAVFHGGIDEIIPMNLLQLLQQAQS